MTGRIIKDYFAGFKWTNFKTKVANFAYLIVYFASILPAVGGFFEKGRYAAIYLFIAIPLLHVMNSGAIHIMRLPKMLFLVPMNQEMKRQYIVRSALFRICFCAFLGLVFTVPLVLLKICDLVVAVMLMFNVLMLSMILCGINERYDAQAKKKWPEIKSDCRGIIQGVNVFITVISSYGIACMLCWDTYVADWVKWIFVGVAVFVQLPLTIKHMTYWNKAVEKALSYE